MDKIQRNRPGQNSTAYQNYDFELFRLKFIEAQQQGPISSQLYNEWKTWVSIYSDAAQTLMPHPQLKQLHLAKWPKVLAITWATLVDLSVKIIQNIVFKIKDISSIFARRTVNRCRGRRSIIVWLRSIRYSSGCYVHGYRSKS